MDMDFMGAFKKPFTDFKKLLIGIALSILPIINFFATGYMLAIAKKEMKKDKGLPEWAEWGNLFVKGLLSVIIGIIYALPLILAVVIFAFPLIKAAIAAGVTSQAGLISMITSSMGGMMGTIGLIAVLLLFIAYIVPSAVLHYIAADKFGEAFKFGSVLKKAFSGNYCVAWIVGMVYSSVLGYAVGFIPYAGSAISGFVSGVTMYSLLGEAFKE